MGILTLRIVGHTGTGSIETRRRNHCKKLDNCLYYDKKLLMHVFAFSVVTLSFSRLIWKWGLELVAKSLEIVIPDDPDEDNGTKL
ncbi:hypothetical protein TNCV_3971311 [Trichonephila clavipes]|nr:hypothetical protein TNCV_3971311 [Trichonephila clavipes]